MGGFGTGGWSDGPFWLAEVLSWLIAGTHRKNPIKKASSRAKSRYPVLHPFRFPSDSAIDLPPCDRTLMCFKPDVPISNAQIINPKGEAHGDEVWISLPHQLFGWCREGESNPQDPKVGGF
jgi:hypothetical protein